MELLIPGAYTATTVVPPPDGSLRATEVQVFPESMRGSGEGHRPMDAAPNTMLGHGPIGRRVGRGCSR
jgi:hypothetical protein